MHVCTVYVSVCAHIFTKKLEGQWVHSLVFWFWLGWLSRAGVTGARDHAKLFTWVMMASKLRSSWPYPRSHLPALVLQVFDYRVNHQKRSITFCSHCFPEFRSFPTRNQGCSILLSVYLLIFTPCLNVSNLLFSCPPGSLGDLWSHLFVCLFLSNENSHTLLLFV